MAFQEELNSNVGGREWSSANLLLKIFVNNLALHVSELEMSLRWLCGRNIGFFTFLLLHLQQNMFCVYRVLEVH
jgi:hypothetical protein